MTVSRLRTPCVRDSDEEEEGERLHEVRRSNGPKDTGSRETKENYLSSNEDWIIKIILLIHLQEWIYIFYKCLLKIKALCR